MTAQSRARSMIESRHWTTLSCAGAILFAGALAALLVAGRWLELRIAASFFLPLLALMLLPHGLPPLLMALITGCFLVSAAGWALDWYALFWWFDVLLHALNPLVMTAASMVMLWKAELVSARAGNLVIQATLLGLVLGIGWELIELSFLALTWPDTILDLAMDAWGAALGGWFASWIIQAWGRAPVGRRGLPGLREPLPVRVRR